MILVKTSGATELEVVEEDEVEVVRKDCQNMSANENQPQMQRYPPAQLMHAKPIIPTRGMERLGHTEEDLATDVDSDVDLVC